MSLDQVSRLQKYSKLMQDSTINSKGTQGP